MSLHITISIGVSALELDAPNMQNTVSAADAALYQAKQQGRKQVVVLAASASNPQ